MTSKLLLKTSKFLLVLRFFSYNENQEFAVYDYDCNESNHKIYYDLNGNELEKYASIYANIDQLQKQLFTGNGMTVYRFQKIPRKAIAVESYFSTVIGLAILSNQDFITGVFVKTFQNLQNKYFLCNTSRRLTIMDNSHSSSPLFAAIHVCRDKRGRKVDQLKILCWKSL